jgi:CheY-like chemotaxis protein
MSRVMLVSMSKRDASQLKKFFSSVSVDCEFMPTLDAAFERIAADPPALVIAEKPDTTDQLYNLTSILKAHAPVTPYLVTMGKADSSAALDCMRAGAYDCVSRPYTPFDVLAAAKRASLKNKRTLFTKKVVQKNRVSPLAYVFAVLLLIAPARMFVNVLNGPPANELSLGSAHLSGLQWDGRSLWVGDWFESTITHYELGQGLFKKFRTLSSSVIYKAQEGQPILICSTPENFVTIDSDLKMRSRHKAVGLPALNSASTPGSNPTGLVWDGHDVWSSDSETGFLYRHGVDLRVLETIKSIIPNPIGLASDGPTLWVLGGTPLQAAKLERTGEGVVWSGPYVVGPVLTEGILPAGLAVGFRRMWFVSGGDPRMVSIPLSRLESIWKGTPHGR